MPLRLQSYLEKHFEIIMHIIYFFIFCYILISNSVALRIETVIYISEFKISYSLVQGHLRKRCFLSFLSISEIKLANCIFKSSILFFGRYLYHQVLNNMLRTFNVLFLPFPCGSKIILFHIFYDLLFQVKVKVHDLCVFLEK